MAHNFDTAINLVGELAGGAFDDEWICAGGAEYLIEALTEAKRLQAENAALQAKLDKAVQDINHIAAKIATSKDKLSGGDEVSDLALGRCDVCTKSCHTGDGCNFKWRGLEDAE